MLAVHCWMHTLQKMCLQGRARTVSTMWSRQMGHRSSRASTGQTHALRLGLGAASWLMAAAALALWGSKDGFGAPRMMDSLEAASCGAVGSLCASTRKSLARLLSHALARSQCLVLPKEDAHTSRVASKTQRRLGPLAICRHPAHCEVTG